jgi:hypothetical protein
MQDHMFVCCGIDVFRALALQNGEFAVSPLKIKLIDPSSLYVDSTTS